MQHAVDPDALRRPANRAATPKAPPNDPERHGNIWQRYEELERAASDLDASNRHLATERSRAAMVRFLLIEAMCEGIVQVCKILIASMPFDVYHWNSDWSLHRWRLRAGFTIISLPWILNPPAVVHAVTSKGCTSESPADRT